MARIMIADDNSSVRHLISILVTLVGHEVVSQASNGLEALSAYFLAKPDLLIVDYQMPVMDGISLIEEITKNIPDLKILICTGSIEELRSESRLKKDVPVIAKPFDNDDFIEMVEAALTSEKNYWRSYLMLRSKLLSRTPI